MDFKKTFTKSGKEFWKLSSSTISISYAAYDKRNDHNTWQLLSLFLRFPFDFHSLLCPVCVMTLSQKGQSPTEWKGLGLSMGNTT